VTLQRHKASSLQALFWYKQSRVETSAAVGLAQFVGEMLRVFRQAAQPFQLVMKPSRRLRVLAQCAAGDNKRA
jgi:hypothetical protein